MRRATALVGVLVVANLGLVAPYVDGVGVTVRSCIYNVGRHNGEVVPPTGASAQGVDMSRDGSKILYLDTTNVERLRIRDRVSGAVVDAPPGVDTNAVWSGDLRRVAAVRPNGADLELVSVDRATSTTTVLVTVPSASALAAEGISDDGTKVVYSATEGAVRVVKWVDVATKVVTPVSATDGATYGDVSASADGRYVVAVRNSAQVWLYDLQTPAATLIGAGIRALVSPGGTTVAWLPSLAASLHLYDVVGASDSTAAIPGVLNGPNRFIPADMSFDGRFLLMSGVVEGTPDPFDWQPVVFDRQAGTVEPFAVGPPPKSVGAALSDDGNRVLTGAAGLSSPDYGAAQAYVIERGATIVYSSVGVRSGRPDVVTVYGNSLPTTVDGFVAPAGVAIGPPTAAGPHAITMPVDSWGGPPRTIRMTVTGPNGCRVNVPTIRLLAPATREITPAVVHPGQRLNLNATENTVGPALVGIAAGTGLTFSRHDTSSGNFDVVSAATAPGGVRTATLDYGPSGDLVVPDAIRVRSTAGEYHPVAAARLTQRTLTGGVPQAVAVAGRLGVPASGVQSVVLNVTATVPTAAGSLTVYPAGAVRPPTLTAAYAPTRFSSNMVIVKLGSGGAVNLFVSAGRAVVTVDVVGWFSVLGSSNRTGMAIDPQPPARAYDSRQHGARPAANSTRRIAPDLAGGLAALASVTVIAPANDGALVLRPAFTANPLPPLSGPATIRYRAGQTVTNVALVPLGLGQLEVVTSASAHYVVDILGVVQPQTTTDGELVRSITSVRALTSSAVVAGGVRTVKVVGVGGVPTNAKSVVVNLTSTNTAVSGSVIAWRSGWSRPAAPNLNTARGSAASNLAVVPIGADGRIAVYSSTATNLIVDIVGFTVSG